MLIPVKSVFESYIKRGEFKEASIFLRKNRKNCTPEEYQNFLKQIPDAVKRGKVKYKPQPDDDELVFYKDNIGLGPRFKGDIRRDRFEAQKSLLNIRMIKQKEELRKKQDKAKVAAMRKIELHLMNGEKKDAKRIYNRYQKEVFGLTKEHQLPDFKHMETVAEKKLHRYKLKEEKWGVFFEKALENERIAAATIRKWLETDDYISEKKIRELVGEHKYWREYPITEAQAKVYHECYNDVNILLIVKVQKHNEEIITRARNQIGTIDGKELDEQQLACICKKAHNHLVIAGAGTGKTFTIVGKIVHLIKSGFCKPEEILAITFTNRATEQMRKKISSKVEGVEVLNFHRLGTQILQKTGTVINRVMDGTDKIILEAMNAQSDDYHSRVLRYISEYKIKTGSDLDFETQEEYDDYLIANPPTTLLGERVKSYGELEIANFLFKNQIRYEYEACYREEETMDENHMSYRPDFYLPDYGIYIEYFGVDRNEEPPKFFKPGYKEGMEWKRNIHRKNKTTMLELYAYENYEKTLLKSLEQKLRAHNVPLRPMSDSELWDSIIREQKSILSGLIKQFNTVIKHIKSGRHEFTSLREQNRRLNGNDEFNYKHNETLLELLEPVYGYYQMKLEEEKSIDFNDMIYKAVDAIRDGRYVNPYKVIIIDEYQDTSKARSELVKALRESCDCELFCVGDDWQSIFQFAGSDLDEFLSFESYWGEAEESKIETTYRYPQKLADISGNFIMENPRQKTKQIKSRGPRAKEEDVLTFLPAYTDGAAVKMITEELDNLPPNSTVAFLGRYNKDNYMLVRSGSIGLRTSYDPFENRLKVHYEGNPSLKMEYMTIHKAKGLEYDYVFLLNNKDDAMGFPSQIQEDPIMSLFIKSDQYQYGEERRLFYVALTRARRKVFLVTPSTSDSWKGEETKESKFVKECRGLIAEWEKERYETILHQRPFF